MASAPCPELNDQARARACGPCADYELWSDAAQLQLFEYAEIIASPPSPPLFAQHISTRCVHLPNCPTIIGTLNAMRRYLDAGCQHSYDAPDPGGSSRNFRPLVPSLLPRAKLLGHVAHRHPGGRRARPCTVCCPDIGAPLDVGDDQR